MYQSWILLNVVMSGVNICILNFFFAIWSELHWWRVCINENIFSAYDVHVACYLVPDNICV